MEFDQALKRYKQYLRREYRKDSTRRNYHRFAEQALEWIQDNLGITTTDDLTSDDIGDYKAWCMDKYKVNGNVGRLHALNNFTCKFLERKDLRVSVPRSVQVNKPVMSEEEIERYINEATDPLEYLIAILQVDGLLRPTEICMLKLSNIDFDNQKLYIDDSKTGDNYIIMSPRLIKAIKNYLPYRIKPKKKEDEDRLIIIAKGSHRGHAPQKGRGDYVYNTTKRIAARAGFERSIYPYLIKPSVITNDLNNRVNPKIVQRKARHKRLESTLRYDHSSDEMVKKHFEENHIGNLDSLQPEDKVRVMMDRMLAGEIDKETFKTSIDILMPRRNQSDDIAYS